jgi:hypothetical protein
MLSQHRLFPSVSDQLIFFFFFFLCVCVCVCVYLNVKRTVLFNSQMLNVKFWKLNIANILLE